MQQRDELSTKERKKGEREKERKKERKKEGSRIENTHFSLRLHYTYAYAA
jgi:hypothetical protein